MENNWLIEDFYYCESKDWIKENTTRVFRLDSLNENSDGIQFFYPMKDDVYVTDEDVNENGEVHINCLSSMVELASYEQINTYIKTVYKDYNSNLKLYDNNKFLVDFYNKMKKEFEYRNLFMELLRELEGFDKFDIYHDDTRYLLNMFRSYYKCRILKR